MMDIPDVCVKPVDFDERIRPNETNYIMDDESETQGSMNEVPKSTNGPPSDNNNFWTDAPARKSTDETPLLVRNILRLTKEGDNRIVNLLEIEDRKGLWTYLIDTTNGCLIDAHSHILEHPEDPYIAAIPMYASD